MPAQAQTPGPKGRRGSKDLRIGFSTGTASAAGAKAALLQVLTGQAPDKVPVDLPGGQTLTIDIDSSGLIAEKTGWAEVIKDGGDDPDVTHKARIRVEVTLPQEGGEGDSLVFRGGPGVGRVTRPGLPVEVGQPAINPVPRKMIRQSLEQVWDQAGPGGQLRAEVLISVERGQELAQHTLNPRLGILGGISILGTHGLVKPFSHAAYTATIDSGVSVLRAAGLDEAVLTTGGKSEKRAMALRPDLDSMAFVQIADFFAYGLRRCAGEGLGRIVLVSFFGKAVKQAMGLEYTHARTEPLDLAALAGWFREAGAGQGLVGQVEGANTARQVMDILEEHGRTDLAALVGQRMLASMRGFAGPGPELEAVIIGFEQGVLFRKTDKGAA